MDGASKSLESIYLFPLPIKWAEEVNLDWTVNFLAEQSQTSKVHGR